MPLFFFSSESAWFFSISINHKMSPFVNQQNCQGNSFAMEIDVLYEIHDSFAFLSHHGSCQNFLVFLTLSLLVGLYFIFFIYFITPVVYRRFCYFVPHFRSNSLFSFCHILIFLYSYILIFSYTRLALLLWLGWKNSEIMFFRSWY